MFCLSSWLEQDDEVGAADTEHARQSCPADLKEAFPTKKYILSNFLNEITRILP